MFPRIQTLFPMVMIALVSGGVLRAADDPQLAEQGLELMKKHCYNCHGVQFNGNAQFNVLVRDVLLKEDPGYVITGKPEDSLLWQRVESDEMPPGKNPKLTTEEKDLLKKWVAAGAPFPALKQTERKFKTIKDVLNDILRHLQQTKGSDRIYQRYYTLTHLYNNKGVSENDFRLYQAAFSKALNSLSWEPTIVVPRPIDPEATIFVVDLRDVGFDEHHRWDIILQAYPYGLKFDDGKDVELRELSRQVELFSGTPLPYIRADWFTFTATQPPLYHDLLGIPLHADDLEKQLKVNRYDDFLRNKLVRAAFAESGVSSNNRLVDRHVGSYGAYWRSYDFAKNDTRSNIFSFPLGPEFRDNPFNHFAFKEAGGELIFNLPNGLQAYMLVDDVGKRIDVGPTNVVADAVNRTSGTVEVINGISCMSCHKNGMIRFQDTLRNGSAVFGPALEKVQDLVPPPDQMLKFIKKDEDRFLSALDEAIGPFLRVGPDEKRDIREFPEPVGNIARFYYRDVHLEEVAYELGFDDPRLVQFAIKTNTNLQKLGLLPVVDGFAIKRELWESREKLVSPFQATAREFDVGTPLLFLAPQ